MTRIPLAPGFMGTGLSKFYSGRTTILPFRVFVGGGSPEGKYTEPSSREDVMS